MIDCKNLLLATVGGGVRNMIMLEVGLAIPMWIMDREGPPITGR